MKKLLVIGVIVLASNLGLAQENVIKLGLLDLSIKKITLNYERVLTDKSSVAVNVGFFIPRTSLPTYITGAVENDADYTSKWGGFSIVPEYRMYTGGDVLNSFYISPYLKFTNYSLLVQEVNTAYDNNITGVLRSYGVGFQIGKQWLINDKVSLDWTIIGVGVNRSTATLRFESNDPGVNYAEIEEDLQKELEDFPLGNPSTDSGADFAKAKLPFIAPSFRTAFTIGYAF